VTDNGQRGRAYAELLIAGSRPTHHQRGNCLQVVFRCHHDGRVWQAARQNEVERSDCCPSIGKSGGIAPKLLHEPRVTVAFNMPAQLLYRFACHIAGASLPECRCRIARSVACLEQCEANSKSNACDPAARRVQASEASLMTQAGSSTPTACYKPINLSFHIHTYSTTHRHLGTQVCARPPIRVCILDFRNRPIFCD
jgi:hypothetical protein